MNFLKNLFSGSKGNKLTILSGGHQKYTQNLVSQLHKRNRNTFFLILNKNYIDDLFGSIQVKEEYNKLGIKDEYMKVFSCNLENPDDIDELLYYIKKHEIKVKFNKLDKRRNSLRSFYFMC